MKGGSGGQIMKEFDGLREKTQSYLIWWEWRLKGKRLKYVCHKFKLEDKLCLEATQLENK